MLGWRRGEKSKDERKNQKEELEVGEAALYRGIKERKKKKKRQKSQSQSLEEFKQRMGHLDKCDLSKTIF